MNLTRNTLRLSGLALALLTATTTVRLHAQAAAPDPKAAAKPAATDELDEFAPKAAPPLPPGMTGSTTNDPRVHPQARLVRRRRSRLGHGARRFLKKPDAFQMSATSADDPKVQKTLVNLLGVGDRSKMPKAMQPVIAQLAFANSDFAFQGTHLFQGNFYRRQLLRHLRPREGLADHHAGLPRRPGRCLRLRQPALHVGRNAATAVSIAARRAFPRCLRRRRGTKMSAASPPPARTASAAYASSIFPTSRIRSR
jgi:hypothetical protein